MTASGDRISNERPGSIGNSPAKPRTDGSPRNYSATHVLRNGTAILIRAVRSGDKMLFRTAFHNLDRDSIYTRFMGFKKDLTEAELEQATNVDFDRVVALVATVGSGDAETIIAGARYVTDAGPAPHSHAEIAFLVEEDSQGQGIASYLLGHLIRIARAKRLSRFYADVLANNRAMLIVLGRSGLPMQKKQFQDVIHVTLSLEPEVG
jgi:GNAT superfamily N-acetyltransferase